MPSAMLRVMKGVVNQGHFTAPEVDMTGKSVLVTGPSIGGIGFETALGLAGLGAKLYLGSRNTEKGEAAAAAIKGKYPHAQVDVLKCDTSNLDSVREMASQLTARGESPPDVIVANAGGTFENYEANAQGVEMTFATCVLGHHLLARLLQPARMVWVSGDIYCMAKGHADPFLKTAGMDAYNRACLGRLLLASEGGRRARETGAKSEVLCVHPGFVSSNFAAPNRLTKRMKELMLISPKAGAQASIYAATCPWSDVPQDAFYFHNKRGWDRLAEDDPAKNAAAAKALFEQCDALCGL